MAQRANFYVLKQIYATTDDNGKVIQIVFEEHGKFCCLEAFFREKPFGNRYETFKQDLAVIWDSKLCKREIYGLEGKFCVCVAAKLNSFN